MADDDFEMTDFPDSSTQNLRNMEESPIVADEGETILALYGEQYPEDTARFLKTPIGKIIIGIIASERAAKAELELQAQEQHMEEDQEKDSWLGWLFAALLHRQAAHAAHTNEAWQQQITDTLHHNRDSIAHEFMDVNSDDDYSTMIESLEDVLNKRTEEKAADHQQIDDKYQAMEDNLSTLDTMHDRDPSATVIETELQAKTAHISSLATRVSGLLNDGKENEAKEVLKEIQGLNIQAAGLQDMLDVKTGNKQLYDANANPVKSFGAASSIIDSDKKLLEKDGNLYLLPKNAELTAENKVEAHQAFVDSKNAQMLKQVVADNKKLEHNEVQQKPHYQQREKEIDLLHNQINQIKATQASALADTNVDRAEHLLKSAPLGSAKTAETSLPRIRDQFHSLMKNPTKQNIDKFKVILEQNFPDNGSRRLQSLLRPGMTQAQMQDPLNEFNALMSEKENPAGPKFK